ncbi:MAG: glycosyltransferase [Candidatus Roizmanbacteria bacterium]|nr:glycosyltransferase [Candidatus Roizmanbacteria bacterium]
MDIKKRNKTLVTVVIPVFNGASYLEEAVFSVQQSTYKNFEILLIDDNSTDHSKKLCRALQRKYTNVRFYALSKNIGLGRVLNYALKKARGEYIARLNQDDYMLPKRLSKQVAFLKKNVAVVAVGSHIEYFGDRNTVLEFLETDSEIKDSWFFVSPFADPSVMYRKETALNVGGYSQAYWPADDTQLWYRMGMVGELANVQLPLTRVRWHKKAASIRFFKKLTVKLYKTHRWAHTHVGPAPLVAQGFWVLQLVSGLLFSPQFNWSVYIGIKRIMNGLVLMKEKAYARLSPKKVPQVSLATQ